MRSILLITLCALSFSHIYSEDGDNDGVGLRHSEETESPEDQLKDQQRYLDDVAKAKEERRIKKYTDDDYDGTEQLRKDSLFFESEGYFLRNCLRNDKKREKGTSADDDNLRNAMSQELKLLNDWAGGIAADVFSKQTSIQDARASLYAHRATMRALHHTQTQLYNAEHQ